MFKRADGRIVKNIEPFQKIMPYIMKTRTDSMNMFEEQIDCEPLDKYVAAKKENDITVTYLDIIIASLVRLIALRPQLNRFIMRGRIYTRPKIWVSFVVHTTLMTEEAGTTIKLCFEGTETISEISETVKKAIARETEKSKEHNGTDKLAATLMKIPGPLISFAVNTLLWLDRRNLLPKSVMDASPFHTSVFVTNLKSLGINPVYHHVYEFGTTGLFIAYGKEKKLPAVVNGDRIEIRKMMGMTVVTDERFCDGLYFARSFRLLRQFFADPAMLEEPLAAKVEDYE